MVTFHIHEDFQNKLMCGTCQEIISVSGREQDKEACEHSSHNDENYYKNKSNDD